ncbi:MAG TPA: hypothetical protein IAD29_02620 [Candidatus Scatocola faecigallinarum]|nr:hypothetical protein [Candidatus Scatocola faecigallinarum]
MSCSRCLYLSALLASVFVSPAAALNSTMVLSDNDFTLKYTHTNTPIPKPASSFADMSRSYKTAGVCFLGVGDCGGAAGYDSSSSGTGSANDDFYIDTSNQCLNEGFVRQNCNSVQTIDGVCPYNSAYGLGCKCLPDLISCPAGQVGVGESCDEMYASCECDPALVACSAKENGTGAECGGKYQSCVCKPEYQYTSSNCSYPRSVSGDSCGGQYTDCVCPAGVDEEPYGCAEYYPSPCSSVCKVAYSDNCHIRESVNAPYYCEKYWDDCPSKCEIAAIDNCINRTAVSTPYGCESYYGDCSSKCQTAYGDNCRNKTAVSVPDNAHCTSYYSDCSSKCSAWSCDSGYNQSGNSCVQTCNYSSQCPGYTMPSASKCQCGGTPCTACGTTKYKCTPNCLPDLAIDRNSCPGGKPGSRCNCGGTHTGFAGGHVCRDVIL